MSTDLTFFTNEEGQSLLDRFKVTIEQNTRYFDVLVGFFRTSGFYHLYKSLEGTERIRVLVGISLNKYAYQLIQRAEQEKQLSLRLSQKEAKDDFADNIVAEMDESPDKQEIQEGVSKFLEWIKSGKMEIRVYPSACIHAKVYIMTFGEKDRDKGRVITGSSNFTEAG